MLTADQVEALAGVSAAIEVLAQVSGSVSGVQSLMVARQVHTLSNRMSGVHAQVLAAATAGQVWAGDGFASAPRWLAESHLMSPRPARDRVADADWLTEYPMFAESLGAGRISAAHITVVRRITTATELRRAAFAQVAVYWVTVAQGRDPDTLAALLRAWAALVDDTEDDTAEKAWRNRALRVTQVGDEWVITGRLPAVEGARLSAVLNEIMDIDRRTRCHCDPAGRCVCPEDDRTVTQRRADALLAIVDAVTARTTTRRPPTPEDQPEDQPDTGADTGADARPRPRPSPTPTPAPTRRLSRRQAPTPRPDPRPGQMRGCGRQLTRRRGRRPVRNRGGRQVRRHARSQVQRRGRRRIQGRGRRQGRGRWGGRGWRRDGTPPGSGTAPGWCW